MCTIELLLQKTMLIEIFKSVHGIGATYLANFFSFNKSNTVPRVESTLYGLHSICYHGTKLWAALDSQSKSSKDLTDFKTSLKNFKGIRCKCKACKSLQNMSQHYTSFHFFCLLITTLSNFLLFIFHLTSFYCYYYILYVASYHGKQLTLVFIV